MIIYILPSILSSKSNYTTKSAQLIEYNIKNIFPENQAQTLIEELVTDFSLNNQN